VDGAHAGIAMCGFEVSFNEPRMSPFGTKRKCHRHLATSAFEGKTDIKIVVADFR
jgi:hypothetical protein